MHRPNPSRFRKPKRTPPYVATVGDARRPDGTVIFIDSRNVGPITAEQLVRTAALSTEIVREFYAAVEATARPLAAEPLVMRLLADAPSIVDVTVTAALVLGCEERAYQAKRKSVWRALDAEGQLPPSRLLLVLRLLWYAKLRHLRWPAKEIAEFLGYSSPRLFRVSVRRRCGVTMEQLNAVSYECALRWAARVCTTRTDVTTNIFAELRAPAM